MKAAKLLQDAFEGDYLALDLFGFEPAILSINDFNPTSAPERIPPVRASKSTGSLRSDRDQRFSDLYERYYASISTYFVKHGFPRETARELTQDVFLRVYREMDRYRGRAEWPFLQGTARSVALNEIRTLNVQKRSGLKVPLEEPAPVTPEDEFADQEEAARRSKWLRDAIMELPGRMRACLLLHLYGFRYNQIAEAHGINIHTVAARLHEARRLLQERMASEGEVFDLPEAPEEDDRDQHG